jgi:SPP1 family predicted phage head-tail adaptor
MLTTAEISAMRTIQESALPDTVVIQRYTTAPDGMGGQIETWSAAGTVDGRVGASGLNTVEQEIAAKLTETTVYVVTIPQSTTIYERDRFVISSRTFEVRSIIDHEAWETARRCVAVEVG